MATTAFITIALDDTAETDIKQSTELIHRLIPGSHGIDSRDSSGADATFFEWDEGDPLPLGRDQVRAVLEANPLLNGDITVVLTVSQEDMRAAVLASAKNLEYDEHDLLHDAAFSFGLPHDSRATILAVSGEDFIVEYATDISEHLDKED